MAGTITALIVQKRNKQRVNIHLDGEFAFGLALIEAVKLHKGQHLDDEDIKRLEAADEIEVAYERSLNYLSYRPRSAAEVRRKLKEKKIGEIAIEDVIARLERAGLLDDADFARFWVSNRDEFKPRSARAISYELRQKGIANDIISEALTDLDEDDAAYRAALSKVRRYRTADEKTFRKKIGDFLARRGFSYGIVRDVLDRLWTERENDNPDAIASKS